MGLYLLQVQLCVPTVSWVATQSHTDPHYHLVVRFLVLVRQFEMCSMTPVLNDTCWMWSVFKIFLLSAVPSEVSRSSSWLTESHCVHPEKLLASRRLGRLRLVAIRRLFPAALSALCRCVRQKPARRHITRLATAVKIAFAWAPRREDYLNTRCER